ncbi:putative nucleic acid-binding Zn-ribbon protein [Lewinella aquimaris]|uniref:Putative nucleic acid-binding Zn-ribbon protein n=1 Tax=Neolewinella aquimaris TaxID=1835722 RepID=A0A840E5C4_9BACT|nr:hypothetical protein [Neolewinella aquimaris]MBB4078357.1 putative nucleic acid-binding Zn-ribbon protein [Neolewinella aquimaris]
MFRTLFKLGLLLVIGLVAYNYFYGTPEEREQSRAIVDKARDLGKDAWDLLRSEREKVSDGKYDEALSRLESLYTDLKGSAAKLNNTDLDREISRLDDRRRALVDALNDDNELSRSARRKLEELTADTEALMHEMEAKSQPAAPY